MKYFNQKCTHCNKLFEKDDDIVVCPVCGTPQHRECYEENNKCINFHKHAEGYVWSASDNTDDNADDSHESIGFTICSNCGTKNSDDSFFCKHCSSPLTETAPNTQNTQSVFNGTGTNPGGNFQGMPFVVPQLMLDPNQEIAENVKLSEAQKYVKTNSLFYSLVFKRINEQSKSKFNFSAFIFAGGWFLYRKQYLLGTILSILYALFSATSVILATPVLSMLESYNLIIEGSILYSQLYVLSSEHKILFAVWFIASLLVYATMILCGLIANRCYYNHVVKKVRQAKKKFSTEEEVNKHLSKTGGVNMILAYILGVAYVIVSSIPLLF